MYKVSYTGDGINTEFLFAFPYFKTQDIKVAFNNVLQDSSTYSVVTNEDFNGGTVVFELPPAKDCHIDIFRQVYLKRSIDYQPTAKIDPEDLNADFNLLLEALKDVRGIELDLSEWANIHEETLRFLKYNLTVIEDKLTGGSVMGLYNNLVAVLESALPKLVNDYGLITDPADIELSDDYGVL